LLIKGGTERIALEVDSLTGNQEVVVKAVGPQLARVPGLAGATVLGNGEVALIINPVALAARAVERMGVPTQESVVPAQIQAPAAVVATAAAVMVVDDSLTVRKISGRLLARHGYHVLTAKDGVDALEQLGETIPDVMLLDIEMPRMDGFDLARNIRADKRLKHIPIIMITSRTADKHRKHAAEIGVNHYLGKPYDEEELLARIRECLDMPK
jgi:chemosensory pili system protein ChpA (sensor histidine kinase/response regulator)